MALTSSTTMLDCFSSNAIAKGWGILATGSFKSCGFAFAVKDNQIMQICTDIARGDGFLLCPQGKATAAVRQLVIKQMLVTGDGNANLFKLATVLKYSMPPVAGTLDKDHPIN